MSQLVAFYALELVVALLVAAAALRMRTVSIRPAWQRITVVGMLIAGWSTVNLYRFVSGRMVPHLDTVFLLGTAAMLSSAVLRFNKVYRQEQSFADHVLTAVVIGAVLAGGLFMPGSAGVMLLVTALLVLLIGFPALIRLGQESRRLWGPYAVATGLFLAYLVLMLYRTVCAGCTATSLALPVAPTVQEGIIASQPVLMLAAVLLLAYSCYLFLHGIVREVDVDKTDVTADTLVQTVVRNIGAMIGEPVAARMAAEAVEDITGARPTVEGSEISMDTEIADTAALVDALAATFAAIGPVGERKVRETAEQMEVNT